MRAPPLSTLFTAILALVCVLAFSMGPPARAQTTINGSRTILGNWDASGAAPTKACTAGTSPPGTCAVGECFFDTDATAGQNVSLCTATDTWTGITAAIAADSVTLGTHTTGNYVASVATTSPLSGGAAGSEGGALTLSIANAAADGSTKGAASFTANDFDASSGNISLDYTNGQASSSSTKGFLTSTDWSTFNGKVGGLSGDTGGTTTGSTVTIAGGVGVSTARSGNTVTVTSKRYSETFSSQTTVTLTGAEHGIGSADITVTCYDNSSPRKRVEPDTVTVDGTSFDVVVTFFSAQTGKCVVQ